MLDRGARCIDCGYRLRGLPSGACPECGRQFDWNKPTTYRTADHVGPVQAQWQGRCKRVACLIALVVAGQLVVAGWWSGAIPPADWTCCCSALLYPVWLVACVVALLAVISPSGWLGVLGCLTIGCFAALLLAATAAPVGLYVAVPAGLIGGLVFKHMELNNML